MKCVSNRENSSQMASFLLQNMIFSLGLDAIHGVQQATRLNLYSPISYTTFHASAKKNNKKQDLLGELKCVSNRKNSSEMASFLLQNTNFFLGWTPFQASSKRPA